MINGNGKTLAGVIHEAKDELKDFLDTRLQMLVGELKQKFSVWKLALPGLLAAAVLALVGFLLMTIALVAAIAVPLGWGWSFLIVGAFYCVVAGSIAFLAYAELKSAGMAPKHTLRVLQEDKIWLQNEARTQL